MGFDSAFKGLSRAISQLSLCTLMAVKGTGFPLTIAYKLSHFPGLFFWRFIYNNDIISTLTQLTENVELL